MRRTPTRLLAILLLIAALAACGAKGPLTMPSDEPAKSDAPAQPEQPAQ